MSKAGPSTTPMMEQYLRMKNGLPEDVLLFFRMGDFYEMFFEDAKDASSLLGLTLTKRHGIPMCGVPHHSAEGYIGRLVKEGRRVAIAEQTTLPQPGKLVERELTRVISAGTLADMNLLDSSRHNYIVALYKDKSGSAWHVWTIPRGSFPWPSSSTWTCCWTSCPASILPSS